MKKAAKVRELTLLGRDVITSAVKKPALDAGIESMCVCVSEVSVFFFPLQKEKAVNDKKEDKKTKKAKENAEAEANEENHSENGEAKSNEVDRGVGG